MLLDGYATALPHRWANGVDYLCQSWFHPHWRGPAGDGLAGVCRAAQDWRSLAHQLHARHRGLRRVVQAAASVATASRHGTITTNIDTEHLVDDDLVERHVVGIARQVFVGDHVVALDDAIGNLAMQPGRART